MSTSTPGSDADQLKQAAVTGQVKTPPENVTRKAWR